MPPTDYAGLINLLGMRQSREREMQRNLELQKTTPGMMVGATRSDVADVQDDMDSDPYTGVEQRAKNAYHEPEQEEARGQAQYMAMQKLFAPLENAREIQRMKGESDVQAAQAKAQTTADATAETRQYADQRAAQGQQATAARVGQSQQNTMLESRAKEAEKGPGPYNLMRMLTGGQTGQQKAAGIRGQQHFGAPQQDQADPTQAAATQLYAMAQDGTPDEIAAALQGQGVADPAQVQAIIAAYQALQGGR